MCGAASSVGRHPAQKKPQVPGGRICSDAELQQLFQGWKDLGVSFSGVMLMAEEKQSTDSYSMDDDKWTTTVRILGSTSILFKTTGDGYLHIRLDASGFHWEHKASYRHIGRDGTSRPELKLVDSSTQRFGVGDLQCQLDLQRHRVYMDGAVDDFPDFAKRVFESLSGKPCEGERPCDMLNKSVDEMLDRR
mmetsp:Transcript_13400/g.38078  ORF Transcript_13400/g.38078 Transcript_13400/m.38078 type:complete len:191 (+) Transcript_13400:101-673(+)